jgi:alkanesulfonate monooxygenase SsuD/methylene tetrahydromethanopterin reductase-like flavin-dependent oxidoreductase (luciferase family)
MDKLGERERMPVEFGIFEHISRPQGRDLGQVYEGRIAFLQKADRAGFSGFHLAEHHGHNLAMAPNQLVFLAALARETERIRLGTLVSCLPLHHPIRLVEEICMVDQLSGGRLDIGVGRGVSIFEHDFFGHDVSESRDRFHETLRMVVQGLSTGRIDSEGSAFYTFPEVDVSLEPAQKPYPPLWYPGNVEYAGRMGLNFVSGRITKELRERYDECWEEGRDDPDRFNPHVTEPKIASSQFVYVAETDEEARQVTERAMGFLGGMVRKSDGSLPPHLQGEFTPGPFKPGKNIDYPGQEGHKVVAGSPDTVREYFEQYVSEGAVNYIIVNMPFGDMTMDEANRSLDLFIDEVMPAVRAAAAQAPAPS